MATAQQRLIGIIILVCIIILTLPFIFSSKNDDEKESQDVEQIITTDTTKDTDTQTRTVNTETNVETTQETTQEPTAPEAVDTTPIAPPQEVVEPKMTNQPVTAPVVKAPTRTNTTTASTQTGGNWFVQVMSLGQNQQTKIAQIKSKLESAGFKVSTINVTVKGKKYTRIQVHGFASRASANASKSKIDSAAGAKSIIQKK